MSLKLYSYAKSSCSWRVRICLALKGIQYEYMPVDLLKDGQHLDEFLSINPLGQVPTLVDNDFCLTQSIAIMEYINDKYSDVGPPLLPKDPHERAQVRQITEIIGSNIQPLQNLSTLKKVGALRKREWAEYWINIGFDALEVTLSQTAGDYCVGDDVTMADACLVPQCRNASQRYRIPLSKYPNICRINDKLLQHSAVISSSPENCEK